MKANSLAILLSIIGLFLSCTRSNNSRIENNLNDSIKSRQILRDSIDNIVKNEIDVANRHFMVSDARAIEIIGEVAELRKLIYWKYENDSTIFNIAQIDGIPNDTFPNWTINIRQQQTRIGQSVSLMYLLVNAKTGEIRIWDIPKDTIMTIDDWRQGLHEK